MPIPPPPPPPPGPPPPPTLSQVGVTSLGGEVSCPHLLELPLERAGCGRGGMLWEVGMWSWAVPVAGGSQGGAELLLLLSRQTQNRRS